MHSRDEILKQFEYNYAPDDLYDVARHYYQLALYIAENIPDNGPRELAILALIVSKDMTVRAVRSQPKPKRQESQF